MLRKNDDMEPLGASPTHAHVKAMRLQGKLSLRSGEYRWHQSRDGEIVFQARDDDKTKTFGELGLSEAEQLALINRLLAHYRPYALPDSLGYYAASAVETANGHLFTGVNNEVHIKDPFSGRGCGETSALRHAEDALHDKDVKIKGVYLMSGKATIEAGKLVDVEPGHIGCLCGECRDNMRSHSTRDTRFIMLPTNDGAQSLILNSSAEAANQLQPNEAWHISQARMYPVPEYVEMTTPDINKVTWDGYLYITNTTAPALPMQTPAAEALLRGDPLTEKQRQDLAAAYSQVSFKSPALAEAPTLGNINRALLQKIKEAYHEHAKVVADGKPLRITALLLKGDDGQFYAGVSVVGEGVNSLPPEFANALSNANNRKGFQEVYMMTFDSAQVLLEKKVGADAQPSHLLRMPKPDGLGRLVKKLKDDQNPRITVLPINNGMLAEDVLLSMSYQKLTVREAFGPDFVNPKSQLPQPSRH